MVFSSTGRAVRHGRPFAPAGLRAAPGTREGTFLRDGLLGVVLGLICAALAIATCGCASAEKIGEHLIDRTADRLDALEARANGHMTERLHEVTLAMQVSLAQVEQISERRQREMLTALHGEIDHLAEILAVRQERAGEQAGEIADRFASDLAGVAEAATGEGSGLRGALTRLVLPIALGLVALGLLIGAGWAVAAWIGRRRAERARRSQEYPPPER
jgi:hypothetical protein